MRVKFIKKDNKNRYVLKAQSDKEIKTYSAPTKTDCFYKFDRHNFRKGFKFFIVEVDANILNVSMLSRDYPYHEHHLE